MQKNKAQLGDFLPLIVALIVIIFFFISCSPLQRRAQNIIQKDISESIMNINADELLLNYLNREVEVNIGIERKKMTFSDLIIFSYKQNDFDEWKKLTEIFLEKYKPHDAAGWNIRLYELPSEDKISSVITYEMIIGKKKNGESIAIIPVLNTDTQIKIRLYKICQSEPC